MKVGCYLFGNMMLGSDYDRQDCSWLGMVRLLCMMWYYELCLIGSLNNIFLDKCCSIFWNRWVDNIQVQEVDGECGVKEVKDYNSEQDSLGCRIQSREEDKMVMFFELVNFVEFVKDICL